MPEHVIIDGNNLLHSMYEHAPIPHIGRESMVRLIRDWASRVPHTVTLVFDGPMPIGGLAKQMQPVGIRVLFSAPETADDIIVRMVRAAPDPGQLHVVSSDTAIRYEARLRRCKHSDSATFIATLFPPTADHSETQAEQPEKPDVVSPQEANEWLDVFGDHDDEDPPFDGDDAMQF
ncbi:MAG: NYN domain-containing protein [Planctomycetes bacterium]|nr:NYN domain-containing protein [Planctomycetota bacterium]